MGLDPTKKSELGCSYEIDRVPVEENHTQTYVHRGRERARETE